MLCELGEHIFNHDTRFTTIYESTVTIRYIFKHILNSYYNLFLLIVGAEFRETGRARLLRASQHQGLKAL